MPDVYRRHGVPDEYRRHGLSWTSSPNCSLTLISAPMPFASVRHATGSAGKPANVSTATSALRLFQAVYRVKDLEVICKVCRDLCEVRGFSD